mgnify:CR=1 FL=1
MEDGRHGGRGVGLELSGRVGRVGTVGRAERAGRADGREGAVRAGRGSNPRVGAVEDRRGGRSCRLVLRGGDCACEPVPEGGSRVWRHSRGHVPGAVPGRWVWVGRHGHRGNGSELCGRVVSELVCVPCEGSRVPMRSVHRPDRRAADRAERVQACAGRWRRGRRPVLVCGRPFGCGAAAGRHALRDERGDRQMGVLQRPPYGWRGVRDGRELPGRFGRRPARGRERWRGAAGGWSVLPGGVICDRI